MDARAVPPGIVFPAEHLEPAEPVDVAQVLYAMQRAVEANEVQAARCMERLDYTAELFAHDVERLREGMALLRWATARGVIA